MVWSRGENGCVPYGQNCVDGGCKWSTSTRQTVVADVSGGRVRGRPWLG